MTSPTRNDTRTDKRLTDLEIKASFAEDMVESLNQIIIFQQEQIDLLMREVALLKQASTNDMGFGRNLRDDLPPHF
jgi:SlyX protein